MREFFINFVSSFLIVFSTIFAFYSINEKNAAFDRTEERLAENEKLLAEYRQELDTLHYSIYQTHLAEDF